MVDGESAGGAHRPDPATGDTDRVNGVGGGDGQKEAETQAEKEAGPGQHHEIVGHRRRRRHTVRVGRVAAERDERAQRGVVGAGHAAAAGHAGGRQAEARRHPDTVGHQRCARASRAGSQPEFTCTFVGFA